VRVWVVPGDLLFGLNYVHHTVLKRISLFFAVFPPDQLNPPADVLLETERNEKVGFRFVSFGLGSKVTPRFLALKNFRFTVGYPHTYSYPSFILPPSFPSPSCLLILFSMK